jgi:hypothetical protein
MRVLGSEKLENTVLVQMLKAATLLKIVDLSIIAPVFNFSSMVH